MPIAASTEIEPVGIASIASVSLAPRRMMDPLPNCRSICDSAPSIAFVRSNFGSAMFVFAPCARRTCRAEMFRGGRVRIAPYPHVRRRKCGGQSRRFGAVWARWGRLAPEITSQRSDTYTGSYNSGLLSQETLHGTHTRRDDRAA